MKIVFALLLCNCAFASELIRKVEEPKVVESCSALSGLNLYAGPHFNYICIYFNNPSFTQGHVGGVTLGMQFPISYMRTSVDFEGSWNVAPITGEPCQRGSVSEYFLEWKVGIGCDCNCWNFVPYSGFGWDEFINIQDPTTVALKYRYDKLFVPVGLFVDWNCKCLRVELQLEYRQDVYSHLTIVGIGLKPQWGCGARAGLEVTEKFHLWNQRLFTLSFVPFFDWNRFGKIVLKNSSGAKLVIPPLIRWDLGMRLLFGYQW